MFIVDIKWKQNEDIDSFSYDSFHLALKETEKFLSGRLNKPISIDVFEGSTKFSEDKRLIASLRIFR